MPGGPDARLDHAVDPAYGGIYPPATGLDTGLETGATGTDTTVTTDSAAALRAAQQRNGSMLCVGLDPDYEKIRQTMWEPVQAALRRFQALGRGSARQRAPAP